MDSTYESLKKTQIKEGCTHPDNLPSCILEETIFILSEPKEDKPNDS